MERVKKEKKKSAKDLDKERIEKKSNKREKVRKEKRKIKRTTWATMPYDYYVSNYVLLLQQNVKVGKEETNLYSKTYELHDTHYHTLIESEQEDIVKSYMAMINGFDSAVGIQISMVNNDMKETVPFIYHFPQSRFISFIYEKHITITHKKSLSL